MLRAASQTRLLPGQGGLLTSAFRSLFLGPYNLPKLIPLSSVVPTVVHQSPKHALGFFVFIFCSVCVHQHNAGAASLVQ